MQNGYKDCYLWLKQVTIATESTYISAANGLFHKSNSCKLDLLYAFLAVSKSTIRDTWIEVIVYLLL